MSELAEGARLEIVCVVYSGTEGSNPSLSATLISFLCTIFPCLHSENDPYPFDKWDPGDRGLPLGVAWDKLHQKNNVQGNVHPWLIWCWPENTGRRHSKR